MKDERDIERNRGRVREIDQQAGRQTDRQTER